MLDKALFHRLWIFAAIPILIFAVWQTSSGLESQMDVRLYDESYYLTQGLFHAPTTFPSDYSPFYSLYYKGLSLFQSDPIALYYLNYRVWAFLFSGLIFLILVRNSVHPGMALLLAIVSLSGQMNYLLWPKAGHFAMLLVGVGLLGFTRCYKNLMHSHFWVAGICLLISWVRPEFFLGFVFSIFILGFQIFRTKHSLSFQQPFIFFPLLASLPLLWLWGLPLGKSGRGNVAFGQHFVHNIVKEKGHAGQQLQEDWVNWREIFQQQTGNPDEMVSAFISNPMSLFRHLVHNVEMMSKNLLSYFAETLVPVHWLGWPVLSSLAILWLLAESLHGFNGISIFWKNHQSKLRNQAWVVFPFALPPLVAGLLFQPRPHYLLPLFPLLFWVLAMWMQGFDFSKIPLKIKELLVGLVLLLALCQLPDAKAWFRVETSEAETKHAENDARYFSLLLGGSLKNVARIQSLQAVQWPANTRIFDGSTGATNFLGEKVVQKGKVGFEMDYPRLMPFELFIQNEDVNAILLAKSLEMDHFFRRISFLDMLKTHPELLGWKEVPLKNSDDRLFFKNH